MSKTARALKDLASYSGIVNYGGDKMMGRHVYQPNEVILDSHFKHIFLVKFQANKLPLPTIVITNNNDETDYRWDGSDEDVEIQKTDDRLYGIPARTGAREVGSRGNEVRRYEEAMLKAPRKIANQYKYDKVPVSIGILTVILFIIGGAVLFAVWENWNVFDGAYFAFVTLTTIGFGDMVPGKSLDSGSEEKLIICSLYLLFGMALIAMCFKLMQDDVVEKTRWLAERIGLLVRNDLSSEEESEDEGECDDNENFEETPMRRFSTIADAQCAAEAENITDASLLPIVPTSLPEDRNSPKFIIKK